MQNKVEDAHSVLALPSSGMITMQQVNIELGKQANQRISLGDADVRSLAGVLSGTISMSQLRGKSSGLWFNVGSNSSYTGYIDKQIGSIQDTEHDGIFIHSIYTQTNSNTAPCYLKLDTGGGPAPPKLKLSLFNPSNGQWVEESIPTATSWDDPVKVYNYTSNMGNVLRQNKNAQIKYKLETEY